MHDDSGIDDNTDKLYKLQEENRELRNQITYLQEEIGELENTIMRLERDLNNPTNYVL